MTKLILSGKKTYIKKMYKHLRKEHPSTRHRMKLAENITKDKNKTYFNEDTDTYYCGNCGNEISRDTWSTSGWCEKCEKGE